MLGGITVTHREECMKQIENLRAEKELLQTLPLNEARELARKRLLLAGIINADGSLAEPYAMSVDED